MSDQTWVKTKSRIYSHDDNSDLISLPTGKGNDLGLFFNSTSLISPNSEISKSWEHIVLEVPILPELIKVESRNTKIIDFKKIIIDNLLGFYGLNDEIRDEIRSRSKLGDVNFGELKLIYNEKNLKMRSLLK